MQALRIKKRTGSALGFTLAEVLIALALLGVVAAFTIPKVLQSSGDRDTTAKLQETVSLLESTWYSTKLENNFEDYAASNGVLTFFSVVQNRLNNIKASQVNSMGATTPRVNESDGPLASLGSSHPCTTDTNWINGWSVLPNGVLITGGGSAQTSTTTYRTPGIISPNTVLCIDVNGAKNPNILGEDVFIGEWNPTGDFDLDNGTVFTRPSQINFNWGGPTKPIYEAMGTPLGAPYNTAPSRVGTYLGR